MCYSRRINAHAVYAIAVTAAVAYAWWAVGRQPFTAGATLAVVGAGLVAMAIGQRRRSGHDDAPVLGGATGWLVVLAALAAWQLLAYFQEPRAQHPTLSSLTNAALDTHAARAAAFVAWLVGAFRLARR